MLFADVEHHLVKGFYRAFERCPVADLNAAAADLVESGRKLLSEQGYASPERQRIAVCADVKYVGQTSPLTVRLARLPVTDDVLRKLVGMFEAEHSRTFGYISPGDALQFVAVKAICQGVPERPRMPGRMARGNERATPARERRAYFGARHGWLATPVMARADLPGKTVPGPVIVEEYDTTVVVRPGWTARTDGWNRIHMERG